MSIFQQRKIFKKIFYSWPMFLILLSIIFLTVQQIVLFYYKNEKIAAKLDINKKRLDKLDIEIENKNSDYQFLKTERGQEEYFRNIFPVSKEGEKVIILYNSTSSDFEIIATSTSYWTTMQKKFKFFVDNYTNL